MLDAALLHEVIAGHDPRDSTSIPQAVPPVVEAARRGAAGDLTGVKLGLVTEFAGEGAEPGVMAAFRDALEALTKLGAEVVEVSCPHFQYALPAYYLIAPSECSSNLARFDGVRYGLRVGDDGDALARGGHVADPRGRLRRRRSSGASCSARTRCPAATTTPTTARRRRCAR